MNDTKMRCPICEEGYLDSRIDLNRVEYHGTHADLELHYSICDTCGSEQANMDQLRDNKRIMIAFRKSVDGLLPGSEVRKIRKSLKLTQREAARIFGGGPVAFSKYESDDIAQSEAMDKLLRVASNVPSTIEFLRKQADLKIDQSDNQLFEENLAYRNTGRRIPQNSSGRVVAEASGSHERKAKNSLIVPKGSVLGIDVGWSEEKWTSSICHLFWDSENIEWEYRRFRAREGERIHAIRSIAGGLYLSAIAIDGPLSRNFDEIGRYRSAERLLSRGEIMERIGKPGQSSSGNGKRLNQQANLSAKALKEVCEIRRSAEKIRIDSLSIHEAFPTTFLGVMVDAADTQSLKGSDQFYEHLTETGRLNQLLSGLLPGRRCRNSFKQVTNHDDRAALICAITALCITARSYTAVGDAEDGWIVLPPRAWFADWAYSSINNNVIRDRYEGNGGLMIHTDRYH